MEFTKMHGAGNDYIYIDAREIRRDWPALAVTMSDRHRGVGADGIILAMSSDRADLRMRMFNADGSEGEMCGNGIRCLVKFAFDNGIVPAQRSPVSVETLAGVLNVTPVNGGAGMARARVGMGEPVLKPEDIPVVAPGLEVVLDYPLRVDGHAFQISCVSMGNPHAVAFIDEPVDEVSLRDMGPLIEHHAMFPRRVNFEIVNVLEPTRLKARVWERGSGLTQACGTGACAVAVAARLRGFTGNDVAVGLPGGELSVSWPGDGQVIREGPVEEVFQGRWPD